MSDIGSAYRGYGAYPGRRDISSQPRRGQGEIQNFFTSLTAAFANSVPSATQLETTLLDPNLLNDGLDRHDFALLITSGNGQPQGAVFTGGAVLSVEAHRSAPACLFEPERGRLEPRLGGSGPG